MESGFTQDGGSPFSNVNLPWLLCRSFFSLVRRWTDNFGDVGCQPSDGRTLRQTRHKARWAAYRNGDHNNSSIKSHGSGVGLVVQHMPSVIMDSSPTHHNLFPLIIVCTKS